MSTTLPPSLGLTIRAAVCAVALAVASSAWAGPGKRIFNVITDFGATGNGVTYDHVAIQNALDAAENAVQRAAGSTSPSGAVVFFPEGIYRVGMPLVLNGSVGIEIVGAGAAAVDVRNPGQTYSYGNVPGNPLIYVNGPSTAIVADFLIDSPSPLFSFTGQVGHTMRDMGLYGCPSGGNPANCTALVQTASAGWGNDNNTYVNLRLRDAVRGFLLGYPGDTNNSEILFERIFASNIETVFQPNCIQSLNLVFRLIGAGECTTVFDFENAWNSGGAVSVDTVTLTACGGEGPDDWVIKGAGQANTGVYRFNSIFFETTSEQLLRSRGSGITQLSNVLDARIPKTQRPAMIRVEGGSVVVQASDLVPASQAGSIGFAPVLEFANPGTHNRTCRLRDCILPVDPNIDVDYRYSVIVGYPTLPASSYYRIDACDAWGNTPLPDTTSPGAW